MTTAHGLPEKLDLEEYKDYLALKAKVTLTSAEQERLEAYTNRKAVLEVWASRTERWRQKLLTGI